MVVRVIEVLPGLDLQRCIDDALEEFDEDYLAIVDGRDQLAPAAAERLTTAAIEARADVAYADEDRLGADGQRGESFYKPSWSPRRLLHQSYLTGLVVYHRRMLGQLRLSTGASTGQQLYELGLQATALAERVLHLPAVLCHRCSPDATLAEVVAALATSSEQRPGLIGGLELFDVGHDDQQIRFEPKTAPSASVVIPTGGGRRVVAGREIELVFNAVRSALALTDHPSFEIIIVLDRNANAELARRLEAVAPGQIVVMQDDRPFNFAAACNVGVGHSTGDIVVLLNDDTEVVSPSWLRRLSSWASLDDVGAVGAKLIYDDGRIQHGGLLCRRLGAGHRYRGLRGATVGYRRELTFPVEVSAVTGACLAVSRRNWDAIGGMDETFSLNYNDLDLCLRLWEQGLFTVQDNQTVLKHLETSSRPEGTEVWEDLALRERWQDVLGTDPYDHPRFSSVGFETHPQPTSLTQLQELAGVCFPARYWERQAASRLDYGSAGD